MCERTGRGGCLEGVGAVLSVAVGCRSEGLAGLTAICSRAKISVGARLRTDRRELFLGRPPAFCTGTVSSIPKSWHLSVEEAEAECAVEAVVVASEAVVVDEVDEVDEVGAVGEAAQEADRATISSLRECRTQSQTGRN